LLCFVKREDVKEDVKRDVKRVVKEDGKENVKRVKNNLFHCLFCLLGSVLQEEQRRESSSNVLAYFVSLAKALFDMRSFHSAAAVWGGLSVVWRRMISNLVLTLFPPTKSRSKQRQRLAFEGCLFLKNT
jgi:hypothetical protein